MKGLQNPESCVSGKRDKPLYVLRRFIQVAQRADYTQDIIPHRTAEKQLYQEGVHERQEVISLRCMDNIYYLT